MDFTSKNNKSAYSQTVLTALKVIGTFCREGKGKDVWWFFLLVPFVNLVYKEVCQSPCARFYCIGAGLSSDFIAYAMKLKDSLEI